MQSNIRLRRELASFDTHLANGELLSNYLRIISACSGACGRLVSLDCKRCLCNWRSNRRVSWYCGNWHCSWHVSNGWDVRDSVGQVALVDDEWWVWDQVLAVVGRARHSNVLEDWLDDRRVHRACDERAWLDPVGAGEACVRDVGVGARNSGDDVSDVRGCAQRRGNCDWCGERRGEVAGLSAANNRCNDNSDESVHFERV